MPPYAISGQTHATAGQDPNAYQIITFQPTTPARLSQLLQFPLYCISPGFYIIHAELHRKEVKLISRAEMATEWESSTAG